MDLNNTEVLKHLDKASERLRSIADTECVTMGTLQQEFFNHVSPTTDSDCHLPPSPFLSPGCLFILGILGQSVDDHFFILAHAGLQRLKFRGFEALGWVSRAPSLEDLYEAYPELGLRSLVQKDRVAWKQYHASWKQEEILSNMLREKIPKEWQEQFARVTICLLHACAHEMCYRIGGDPSRESDEAFYAAQRLPDHALFWKTQLDPAKYGNLWHDILLECAVTFSNWLLHKRDYAEASKILATALGNKDRDDVRLVAEAYETRAQISRKTGELQLAEKYQKLAIEKLTELHEATSIDDSKSAQIHRHLLQAQGGLATIYRDQGLFNEAISTQRKAIGEMERMRDVPYAALLHAHLCEGTIHLHQREPDYDAAGECDNKALGILRKDLKDDINMHTQMLEIRAKKGAAYTLWGQKCLKQAIALEHDVLECSKSLYGPEHALTAIAQYDLATSVLAWANELSTEALSTCRRAFGENDERLLRAMRLRERIK